MSVNLSNATPLHLYGDSITAGQGIVNGVPRGPWYSATGGFADQVYAATNVPPPKNYYASPSGPGAVIVSGGPSIVQSARQNNITAHGVGGKTSGDVLADLPGYIFNYTDRSPTGILVGVIGTNDFGTAVPGATYLANMQAIYNAFHARSPGWFILHCSTPVRSEQYTVGPPAHLLDGLDTWTGNTLMQTECLSRSTYCEYVDFLALAMAWEIAHNTPPPGVSPVANDAGLTYDQLHPEELQKLVIMAVAVLSHINFV